MGVIVTRVIVTRVIVTGVIVTGVIAKRSANPQPAKV
jgi:hypothetical protein